MALKLLAGFVALTAHASATYSQAALNSSAFLLLHPPRLPTLVKNGVAASSPIKGQIGPGASLADRIASIMNGISNEFAQRVFVIRRALDVCTPGPIPICVPKVDMFAHSALLLSAGPRDRGSVSDYWIVEYMRAGNHEDGEIHWRPVKGKGLSSLCVYEPTRITLRSISIQFIEIPSSF